MKHFKRKRCAVAKIVTVALVLSAIPFTGKSVTYAQEDETEIVLSDTQIMVDGEAVSTSSEDAVYTGADIIYYEAGHDDSYGEGSDSEAHTASEAALNTVVTITQPGTYRVSGTLSKGQLAVDLGEDADEDENAVVTLILDGADITCTVAPAVIFYNVWESESTTEAGANVVLADDSVNTVNGSHVAKIYKEGTTKKRYKFDGAFYSKMTMNIDGESQNNGELHITADNEGLDSELHLTVDGGKIWIDSQDDGINTNEDNVSIFTMNDGYLYVNAGNGSEGDGIDSNGSIKINGGTVISLANPTTPDGGLDADDDILINGGTVAAFGVSNEEVSSDSTAPYLQLSYANVQPAGQITYLTDTDGTEMFGYVSEKTYQSAVIASPSLAFDTTYYLYNGGTLTGAQQTDGLYAAGGSYSGGVKQQYNTNAAGEMMQPDGDVPSLPDGSAMPQQSGMPQQGGDVPSLPDGSAMPQQSGMPQQGGDIPSLPDGSGMPQQGGDAPTQPGGNQPSMPGDNATAGTDSYSTEFTITQETRSFRQITASQEVYGASVTATEEPAADVTPVPTNDNTGNTAASNGTSGSAITTTATVTAASGSSIQKVKKTAIAKVKRSKNGKKMTVKVKKTTQAAGYQIRYSTSKKFTKATTKKVNVSKKTLKKTISSLKAKKIYYVSARAYRKVDGKKYYSAWSAAKKVKAKKTK